MPFIGTNTLTALLTEADIITPFDPARVKNGSYELSLGSQVFQTGAKPRSVKTLSKGEKIYIEPGQFALLLTEERINVPKNKIAFISIKAGIKFNGLINVSGFHVDPGFDGKLLFSVYNAGPSTIVLSQGTPYFPIWFSELNESQEYIGTHNGQTQIPDDPIRSLSQGVLASPNELSRRIDETKHLKTKIEWVCIAILTFLSGLLIKSYTENSKLKEAIEFGYQKKSQEVLADSAKKMTINDIKVLKSRVDSLEEIVETKNSKTSNYGK